MNSTSSILKSVIISPIESLHLKLCTVTSSKSLPLKPPDLLILPNIGRLLFGKKIAAKKVGFNLCLYEATRHSAASEAASRHESVYVFKECLGHENIKATQRYAKVDMKAKRSVMEEEKIISIKKDMLSQ